jgi:segregation and condensation protein B
LSPEIIESVISDLVKKFQNDESSFELMESGGGFQFLSKPAFQSSVSAMWKQKIKKRLSTSALETLSIIAYKQPVSKPEIEKIRGVNCDYAVQKLLEKELIVMAGRSDQPGRPVLYATSKRFMDYFGINHLSQLPDLKEINPEENVIGENPDE